MDLNSALRIVRRIILDTTNTEITLEANDKNEISKIRFSLDRAYIDYLQSIIKVFKSYGIESKLVLNCEDKEIYFAEPEKKEETEA